MRLCLDGYPSGYPSQAVPSVAVLAMLLAVPVGLVVGLCLGALGGGGSILTVPALVYVLGQNAHGATTASLVIVGTTALAGSVAHRRAGRVQLGKGLTFGALGVAGSFVGSRLSSGVSTHVLLAAFAALLIGAASAMLRRARRLGGQLGGSAAQPSAPLSGTQDGAPGPGTGATGGQRPAPEALPTAHKPSTVVEAVAAQGPAARRQWPRVVVAATVVGLLTGFFGVGGGFVVVPALVLVLRLDMPQAVGTSLVVIAINSAAALASRVGTHAHVDWRLTAVFMAAAVVGSLGGNRVAGRARPEVLGSAFSLLLVAVAGYVAARSVPALL